MATNTFDVTRQVFIAVLELPEDTDVTALEQQDLEAWDSLAHVLLCTALESEFDLQIDLDDAVELTSFTAALEYLERRLALQAS